MRRKQPGSSLGHLWFYEACAWASRVIFRACFGARADGMEHVPGVGPCLVASNHQSYLDPPLVGSFVRHRHLNFIAKSGLFRFRPFGWLIGGLNSLPIREDAGDAGAIKEVLRRLDEGGVVLIFPEGSRTPDGAMHEFKRGVTLLVKRSKCPVVPAAVEGCFDAWPRGGKPRPWTCPVAVRYGKAISHEELMAEGAEAGLKRLEREIARLRAELRAEIRARTGGKYPRAGAGDATAPIPEGGAQAS